MFTNILTMGQVLPRIRSESCMHMGTSAKGRIGARAHKAILYEIVDLLVKVEPAIRDVLHAPYLLYCLSWRIISPLTSRTSLSATATLAKF